MTEIDKQARKRQTIVYAFGKVLAYQRIAYVVNPPSATETVNWEIRDPSGTSVRVGGASFELDPEGTDVGTMNPDNENAPELFDPADGEQFYPFIGGGGGGGGSNWRCQLDGISLPCDVGYRILGSGEGVIQRGWDNVPVRYNGQTVWAWFTATADGYSGYIPTNATYIGGGRIQPVGYGGPPRFSPSRGNSPPDTNIGQLNGVTDLSERDLLHEGNLLQMSCAGALKQANKSQQGLERANNALPQITSIVNDVNIARLLAAIGIQETDFRVMNQQPSGPGRGIFQIEPKTYGITEAEANNLPTAVNAIANNWSRSWADILTGFANGGYDASSSSVQYLALAGLARVYHRGRAGVVTSDSRGNVSIGSLLDVATQSGDVTYLENAGTNRDKRFTTTAHGTYVRNVIDLFFSCLGG
ncbi:MAG: hypothetical protein ACRD6X_17945 [Pyrinomonadaceae bacterium]